MVSLYVLYGLEGLGLTELFSYLDGICQGKILVEDPFMCSNGNFSVTEMHPASYGLHPTS